MQDESKANLLFSLHNERRHNEQLRKQLELAQAEIESHKIARDLWIDEAKHLRQALEEALIQGKFTYDIYRKLRKALEDGQSEN